MHHKADNISFSILLKYLECAMHEMCCCVKNFQFHFHAGFVLHLPWLWFKGCGSSSLRNICVSNVQMLSCRNVNTTLFSAVTYYRLLTRAKRCLTPVELELFTFPEHLSTSPVFCLWCSCSSTLFFLCSVLICRSLFVFLTCFFWSL